MPGVANATAAGQAGSATLFGMGCGGAPQGLPAEPEQQPTAGQQPEVQQQAVYMVCWGELGVYDGPSTSNNKVWTMSYGNHFNTDSSVFWSNGEYWVRGSMVCSAPYNCYGLYGYVRWAGLCH
jgi:hypothetical protein